MASEERNKEILEGLKIAVKDFEEEDAATWAKTALEEGVDPCRGKCDDSRPRL